MLLPEVLVGSRFTPPINNNNKTKGRGNLTTKCLQRHQRSAEDGVGLLQKKKKCNTFMKLISQAVHGVCWKLKWNVMCFKISKSLYCVINCMWTVEDNSDVFFVLFFNKHTEWMHVKLKLMTWAILLLNKHPLQTPPTTTHHPPYSLHPTHTHTRETLVTQHGSFPSHALACAPASPSVWRGLTSPSACCLHTAPIFRAAAVCCVSSHHHHLHLLHPPSPPCQGLWARPQLGDRTCGGVWTYIGWMDEWVVVVVGRWGVAVGSHRARGKSARWWPFGVNYHEPHDSFPFTHSLLTSIDTHAHPREEERGCYG